jgi:TetR/AcrR family transcriptional regulator
MDHIAKAAKVNKAMLHYYFSSKQNLYQLVVKDVFLRMSPMLIQLIASEPEPKDFLEQVTDFYIDLYTKNPDFVRMMVLELIQNPKNITAILAELFQKSGQSGPPKIFFLIRKWQEEGKVTEEDPFQFMLNVISLSLLSFIGKPILEGVFRLATGDSPAKKDFKENRVKSVIHLLKHGMLT